MRFILIANGLINRSGHHYMEARSFREEAAQHGIDCLVLAHRDIAPELRGELSALPLFHHSPYAESASRRFWRQLLHFWRLGRSMAQQLLSLQTEQIAADDMVVCPLTKAAEMLGLALWLKRIPRHRRPRLALNFMIDDISRHRPSPHGITTKRLPVLCYRGAFSLLRKACAPDRLLLSAGGDAFAHVMARILKHPVQVFPLPVQHKLPPQPPGEGGPGQGPLIVYLGHMHRRKGAHLVGEIVRRVLVQHSRCRFLLQANPLEWGDLWSEEIGPIGGDRVLIHRGEMGQGDYQSWLHRADLVLMPYVPQHYRLQTSGVFSEAMALGKPCIIPEGTWLAEMARRHYGGVTIFPSHTPAAIADAVLHALDKLADLAVTMATVSRHWRETMGMEAFVQRVLAGAAGRSEP